MTCFMKTTTTEAYLIKHRVSGNYWHTEDETTCWGSEREATKFQIAEEAVAKLQGLEDRYEAFEGNLLVEWVEVNREVLVLQARPKVNRLFVVREHGLIATGYLMPSFGTTPDIQQANVFHTRRSAQEVADRMRLSTKGTLTFAVTEVKLQVV